MPRCSTLAALALIAASCAPPPLADDGIVNLVVVDRGTWLDASTVEAVSFWHAHRVDFVVLEDDGDVPILFGDTGGALALAYDDEDDELGMRVVVDEARLAGNDDLTRRCLLAHEIGHLFGLKHVEAGPEGSLMSSPMSLGWSDCPWSEFDQSELERVFEESGRAP